MLSVVIPALNEGVHLRSTVESLRATVPDDTEIIVVDDDSNDGCADFLRSANPTATLLEPEEPPVRLGAPQARNKGARAARGELIIFTDAHMQFPAGWAEPLAQVLDNPSVGAAAPAISVLGSPENKGFGLRWHDRQLGVEWLPSRASEPYDVPLLPGACFALRRDLFVECGGFDVGLSRWGLEDSELSLRLWTRGYDLCMVPEVDVAHLFRERHPYAVDWDDLLFNTLRVAWMHFSDRRLTIVIDALKPYSGFANALSRLADSDAGERRTELRTNRARDDDAYFRRFGDIL